MVRGVGTGGEFLSTLPKMQHWLGGFCLERVPGFLSGFFGQPVAQVQVLLDFSAFVPVFMGFFGAVICFAEGMFGTSYGLGNHVQCFRHI
jgi:hypothetical protein